MNNNFLPYQLKKNAEQANTLATQMAQSMSHQTTWTNVLYPPAPLVGAKGDYYLSDGSINPSPTDDTTAIQNILANVKGLIYFGDASKGYKISGTLTLDYVKNSLFGDGATLYFTNLGTGINIASSNSLPNNGYRNTGIIQGLFLQNSNGQNTSGSTGLLFGGTNVAGHNLVVKNCLIDGFYTGVNFSSNAYLVTFDHVGIQHSNWCVNFPTGITNSGENIRFINCVLANATNGVNINASQFRFTNCSFDYITNKYVSCLTGGVAFLENCHVEGNSDTDYWLYTNNSNSQIIMKGGTIAVSGSKANYFVGQGNNSDGGIHLSNIYFIVVNGSSTYAKQTLITGWGSSKNILPFVGAGQQNRQGHDTFNYLAQGGFEAGTTAEWTSDGSVAPTVDNTTAHSGTQSMKYASTSANYISMYHDVPCNPGDKPKFSGFFKANFNGSADTFYVIAQYFDALGNALSPSTYTLSISSGSIPTALNGVNPTSGWALYSANCTTPAPAGAAKCRFKLRQCNPTTKSDGLAVGWWDDILLTVD
jgi:hypothetical protein